MLDAGNEKQEANLVQNKEGVLSGLKERYYFAERIDLQTTENAKLTSELSSRLVVTSLPVLLFS